MSICPVSVAGILLCYPDGNHEQAESDSLVLVVP